jgi:LmbE family N-acetylglucosaminyl deacetylase
MHTVIAFHAHPDDEAILTGGTLARLAAEGHRVLIVVACDGLMGELPAAGVMPPRLKELQASARILGVARVECLGYADSGHGPLLFDDPADRQRFVRADVDEAAGRLAKFLTEARADVLFIYDENGGYGHRDHVRVHTVGMRAAQLAGTSRVLKATMPREPVVRLSRALASLGLKTGYDASVIEAAFTPRAAITHRVDVRKYARQKRGALRAHRSQVGGKGRASLPLRLLAALPLPLYRLVAGREWFAEVREPPGIRVSERIL